MVALKYTLILLSLGIFTSAAGIVGYDVFRAMQLNWLLGRKRKGQQPGTESFSKPGESLPFRPVRLKQSLPLALVGLVLLLMALSIIVPDGSAGIRVRQPSGMWPGTLYPGVHLVTPLVDTVFLYDTREQAFPDVANDDSKSKSKATAKPKPGGSEIFSRRQTSSCRPGAGVSGASDNGDDSAEPAPVTAAATQT